MIYNYIVILKKTWATTKCIKILKYVRILEENDTQNSTINIDKNYFVVLFPL